MLSDFELHVISTPEINNSTPDQGAGGFNFRTPTLRNLSITGPYMHNGRFNSLERVMNFYRDLSRGNSQNTNVQNGQLSSELSKLNVRNRDFPFIIAFLRALNDSSFDRSVPASVPSGLSVGGNIN